MENIFLKLGDIKEPLILFFINVSFDPENSHSHHLYDCTRQFWYQIAIAREYNNLGELNYQLALGVYHGEVKGVFKIQSWHPAGTTHTTRTEYTNFENRWEFVGKPIENSIYKSKILMENENILDGHQYPFRYIN